MASLIVKSAAQQLGKLVVVEAQHLYKVRDKIESLQTELEWMECFLRDADTQQHQEKVICKWVSQVRDLAYDSEDIIQRYLHEVSHEHQQQGLWNTLKWFSCILFTCDAWALHNLGSEIDSMTIQISELTSRLQRYGIQIIKPTRSPEYNVRTREEWRTYSHTTEEDVVGIKEYVQKVVDKLLKENVSVVSITGTGGLGKTTLARKVFSSKDIQDGYTCIWVYISQEFESSRIFKEILDGLTKGESEHVGAANVAQEIEELLWRENCFVVLDDIWTVEAWMRLKPAFQSIKSCQSKILLTTRKQDLLQHVDPSGYLHRMGHLSLKDSWELLQRKALIRQGSTNGDQVTRERLGKEMLKHCDGLPLAIVALGGILSTKKSVSEWREVKQNIASYLMSGEQGNENGPILEVIELSYHDLPFYLKPCFLYFGNFPEGYEISTQRLYHLWEAEGLLIVEGGAKKGGGGGTSYDVGERYLSELVQRSMVQVEEYYENGRIKKCKVHDIMRDLCLKKGEEINYLNIVEWTKWDMESVLASCCSTDSKKPRRCAVHWKGDNNYGSRDSDGKNGGEEKATSVRSVLVFPLDEEKEYAKRISARPWKPFPLLRVLDVEGAAIEGLVEGVEDLIHLRYLSLRKTFISELQPGLCDLKCLETLDLRSQKTMKLPCKLDKLERLRHLYLPYHFKVEDGEKLSLPVRRLETLENFTPSKCESKDLLKMTELRVFMIRDGYTFDKKDELKCVVEAPAMKEAGQLINTMRLTIKGSVIKEEPTILSSLAAPPSCFELFIRGASVDDEHDMLSGIVFADSLTSVDITGCYEIGEAHVSALGRLPHLEHLRLWYADIRGGKMTFSAGSFPRLNSLELDTLTKLEEWEVEEEALPNLQRLELNWCSKLKKLPQRMPHNLHVKWSGPCFSAVENYNIWPDMAKSYSQEVEVGTKYRYSLFEPFDPKKQHKSEPAKQRTDQISGYPYRRNTNFRLIN